MLYCPKLPLDYARWEAIDPDGYARFSSFEHTALEFMGWIEEQIDIKICWALRHQKS